MGLEGELNTDKEIASKVELLENGNEQEIHTDTATLAFVYEISATAFERLMDDIDTLEQQMHQSLQLNFILVGIVAGILGTAFRSGYEFSILASLVLVIALILLALSTYRIFGLSGNDDFDADIVFPHLLLEDVTQGKDIHEMKAELLTTLAESYYFNYHLLDNQSHEFFQARQKLLWGSLALIAAIVIEACKRFF